MNKITKHVVASCFNMYKTCINMLKTPQHGLSAQTVCTDCQHDLQITNKSATSAYSRLTVYGGSASCCLDSSCWKNYCSGSDYCSAHL